MIADLLEAWAELEAALPGYLEAEAYATGQVDEVFASDGVVARKLAQASRHYQFPLISVPVKARVNRCKLTAVKVGEDEGATNRITEIWDANDMDVWYPELLFKTFMFGDAYLMVWPIQDDNAEELESGSPADDELVKAGVEFTVHSPKHGRMLYDTENERRKRLFINRWQIDSGEADGSKVWRVDLWYADTVEHWVSLKDGQLDTEAGWMMFEEEDPELGVIPAEEPNPTGEIPFFHHRTGLPYGTPVHKLGYGAQNALTKMLVTQIDTSDSQGWPHRYRLLDPDAELDQNSDDPQWLDDNDAPVFGPEGVKANGGANTSLRTGPGTIQTFPGTKEVGQFDAADPELFLGPAKVYIKLMATLTDTPAHHFYPEETPMGQAPSGAALTKAEAPLIAAVQRLQTLQRGAIREEWTFGLGLTGVRVRPGTLDVQWEPVERATDLEDWQKVLAQQEAGVPVDQTLEEAGYTAEQAEEWRKEREEEQAKMQEQMAELAGANGKPQGAPSGQPAPAGAR